MDFEDGDSSESDIEELESELYSVLHYNIFADGVPSTLLDKYDIKVNENGEYLISLKKPERPQEIEQVNVTSLNGDTDKVNNSVDSALNIITITDDESNDVILNEQPLEITYISSPSIVEVPSSDESSDEMNTNMVLNISNSVVSSESVQFDDILENTGDEKMKWMEVISPKNWTMPMRKYYNKSCKRMVNFDYNKVLEELRGNNEDWSVHCADRLHLTRRPGRCSVCKTRSRHKGKICPYKVPICHMCGKDGHRDYNCPFSMCLNCGIKTNGGYISMCWECDYHRFTTCNECEQTGHIRTNCPDNWRRYHSTTKGDLVVQEGELNKNLVCCNCTEKNHLFENCPKLYDTNFPPTSFLVKNAAQLAGEVPKDMYKQDPSPIRKQNKFYNNGMQNISPMDRPSTSFNSTPIRPPNKFKRKRRAYTNQFENEAQDNVNFNKFLNNRAMHHKLGRGKRSLSPEVFGQTSPSTFNKIKKRMKNQTPLLHSNGNQNKRKRRYNDYLYNHEMTPPSRSDLPKFQHNWTPSPLANKATTSFTPSKSKKKMKRYFFNNSFVENVHINCQPRNLSNKKNFNRKHSCNTI